MLYKCPQCGGLGTQLWIVRGQWALMDGDVEIEQKITRFHTRKSLARCPGCGHINERSAFFPKRYDYAQLRLDRNKETDQVMFMFSIRCQDGSREEVAFSINRAGYKQIEAFFSERHVESLMCSSSIDFPSDFGIRRRQIQSCMNAIRRGMESC